MSFIGDIENGMAQGWQQGSRPAPPPPMMRRPMPPMTPPPPPPMMNPMMQRVNQYTQLLSQADPGQQKLLIGHMLQQAQAGNTNVLPYLQVIQSHPVIQQHPDLLHQIGGFLTNPIGTIGAAVVPQLGKLTQGAGQELQQLSGQAQRATNGIPVVGWAGRNIVNPMAQQYGQSMQHVGGLEQGQIPTAYTQGSVGQRIGAVGTDVLNAVSLLPVGEAAQGVKAGLTKAPSLLKTAAKSGAINAGFGAGYGVTGAMQQGADLKHTALSGVEGAALGGALGAGLPLAGAAAQHGIEAIHPYVQAIAQGSKDAIARVASDPVLMHQLNTVAPELVAAIGRGDHAGAVAHATNLMGYIAGPKAGRFDKMADQGRIQGNSFERSDSKLKVDPNAAASLDNGRTLTLGQLVKHKELARDYSGKNGSPNLMNTTRVEVDTKIDHPTYDKYTNAIYVRSGKSLTTDVGRTQLVHEVQHAIDHAEGREAGTTPEFEAFKHYTDEEQRAMQVNDALQPQIDSLKQLVKRGNLTPAEYEKQAAVVAYKKNQTILKGVSTGNTLEDRRDYLANSSEQRARQVAERSTMTQKEIDANPQRLPVVRQAVGMQGRFAYAKEGDVTGKPVDEGKMFYHGTSNPNLKSLSDLQSGKAAGGSSLNRVYMTENPEIAKNFGSNVISGKLYGKHLNATDIGVKVSPDPAVDRVVSPEFADYKTSKLLTERDKRVFENSFVKGVPTNTIIEDTPNIHKYLVSKGYTTITVPRVHSDVTGARTESIILDHKNAFKSPPTPTNNLHLDEPTPREQLGENPTKAQIGEAKGKTEAYIKRIDQTLATDPTNIELRNRRLQLARELQELKSAYHNPSPFKSGAELGGGKEAGPVSREAKQAQEVIDTLAKEKANLLRETDKMGGVSTLKTEDGYKRVSSNSPFYRQYYKEHGKPPTMAAYLEEAHRQLRIGSDADAASYQEALRSVNKDFKDTQDYARAFGISEEQAAKELAQKAKNPIQVEVQKNPAFSRTAQKLANMKEAQAEEASTRRAIESQKKAPAPTSLPEAKTTQDAVRNMDTANQLIMNRTERVAALTDRELGKDPATMRLFSQALEHPDQAPHLAQVSGNPEGFMRAIVAHKDLTNYVHSLRQGVGKPVPYVEHYVQHQWDLSDPKKAEEYANLAQMKGKAANARVFSTIDEGEKAGFKLKPQSAGQLVHSYGRNEASAISKQALVQSLAKLHPNDIKDINFGDGSLRQDGQAFRQLQVPGLENYHVSPELYKQLKGVQHNLDQHTVTKIADTINTAMKQVSLSFGGFHDLNESLRFAGQELTSLRPSGLIDLVQARHEFFSPKAHETSMAEWQKSGLLDAAAKSNLSGGQGADIHSLSGKIEKLNPANEALFGREISFYKLRSFEKEVKRLGVKDLNNLSEGDLARLRKVSAQINNWYGGLNLKIINRSPVTQQFLRFTTLAPDFQEGGFRTVGNAAAKWGKANPEGNLARRQLLGNATAVAIAAYVASRMLGQNPQNFAQSLLDPQVKLPFKSPTGKAIVASLPTGPIAEVAKAIGGPGHFLTSHMAAVPSVGVEAIQGKDYYGNPLVDPFKNPNPSFIQNVGGALKSKVPIALGQGQKAFNGTENAGEAIINTLGGRVKNDPNDPANQAQAAYFKSRDQFTKSLNPNDLALFNTMNPIKKDSSGNPVYTKSALTNASDYAKLLDPANKDFADKYTAWEQSQPSHDPLWDLTPDSRRAYMFTQVLGKYDPKGDPATTKYLQGLIPNDFYSRRTAWFNSLPKTAQSSSNTPQSPQMTPQLQDWYSKYYSQLPSGTGARTQALNTPMGQLFQSYMNASDAYTNQQRVSMGLPAFAVYGAGVGPGQIARPGSSSSSGKSSSSSRSTAKRNIKNQYKFATNELSAEKKRYKTTKFSNGSLSYGKVAPRKNAWGQKAYMQTPGEKRVSSPRVAKNASKRRIA